MERFLEEHLRADALDLLVEGEEGWEEHDRDCRCCRGPPGGRNWRRHLTRARHPEIKALARRIQTSQTSQTKENVKMGQ